MPTPVAILTQTDLESAVTAEKVRQLLSTSGKSEPDPARVRLVLESATGYVFGKIQVVISPLSIDTLWDTVWNDRDKSELRRLALSTAIYYLHFYGQKAEEIPQTVIDELERVEARCTEIAESRATIGADPAPDSSAQNIYAFTTGAGNNPEGSPRSRWRGF